MPIRRATHAEHKAHLRPVSSPREVGASSLAAPAPTGQGPATPTRSKQWQQLALLLDQLSLKKPRA